MAVISSMDWGFIWTQTPVMPVDSNWKTPEVLPSPSMAKVSGSSSGMSLIEKPGTVLRISFSASSITVRFRSPKKSILSRPSSSMVVIVNCVTTVSSFFASGT